MQIVFGEKHRFGDGTSITLPVSLKITPRGAVPGRQNGPSNSSL